MKMGHTYKNSPCRSRFSLPRAFRTWSRICRSPYGLLENYFIVCLYRGFNPALPEGLINKSTVKGMIRVSICPVRKYTNKTSAHSLILTKLPDPQHHWHSGAPPETAFGWCACQGLSPALGGTPTAFFGLFFLWLWLVKSRATWPWEYLSLIVDGDVHSFALVANDGSFENPGPPRSIRLVDHQLSGIETNNICWLRANDELR